jgi:spermidine/putrescine transport system ATP-binding protein
VTEQDINDAAIAHAASRPVATAAGAAEVRVEGVRKRFGNVVAVDGVDLTVHHGEFFSLLGPSGCGKTTLLRLIGGFEMPDEGTVQIGGRDVTEGLPYERPTNMIFQHLALFPHMSVFDNVGFGLRMKRRNIREIERRVGEALSMVRMDDYARRTIDQLSGGQQQRVAIARALVNDPAVMLLDEPLGALDLKLRLELQVELRRLHKALNSTFVFVTHDQSEALIMSDRIAVMDEGRIVQIGTPGELYERPETRFVAQFIGQTNLLEGRVVRPQGIGRYIVEIGGLQVIAVSDHAAAEGLPVTLSLRYEKVRLSPGSAESVGKGATDCALTSCLGTVADRTYMGPSLRYDVQISSDLVLTADVANEERETDFVVGQTIRVSWSAESVRLIVA